MPPSSSPYLRLQDTGAGRPLEFRKPLIRLGRDPASDIVASGANAKVVSADHATLEHTDKGWVVRDKGSKNGVYRNGARIMGEAPLAVGDRFSLGESGPAYRVEAVTERTVEETMAETPAFSLKPTLIESPAVPAAPPPPPAPASRGYSVILRHAKTQQQYMAQGTRVRLGRGNECEVQPVGPDDTTVSRVHAELTIATDGHFAVRDVNSRNGTFLNGQRITKPMPIRLRDRIMLGTGGPELIVEGIGTAPSIPAVKRGEKGGEASAAPSPAAGLGAKTVMGMIGQALQEAKAERRRGGRGSEAFLREVVAQVSRQSRWRRVMLVLVLLLLFGGGIGFTWWYFAIEAEETQQALEAERVAADSARASSIAEAARLRNELDDARRGAAPVAQVESLRAQLLSAQARTGALESALTRAQAAVQQQLQQGERRRVESQEEVRRLRDQLSAAEKRAPPQEVLDSLRQAMREAERQAASVDARMRALRGTDFAGIAQKNQGAIGLITVAFGPEYYNGSGFVVHPEGYMLTNWHVVADSAHSRPDTLWVTMADQATSYFAEVVAASREHDVAVIKVRGYRGPFIDSIDWTGSRVRQGEPAALIGFPKGMSFARYRSSVVRTSMTAGIISRVTDELVQFDGMTVGGSSGSPIFNGNGQVIAVHRAGLPEAPGFALAVPVQRAIPLIPLQIRPALGIP
jgi:pSer/pThr/pTyr-binding forkhead associated (FHA) protein/S1-C subfamily serine protease